MSYTVRQLVGELEKSGEKSMVFYSPDSYYRIFKIKKPNMQLKKSTLGKLKDNQEFRLSKRNSAAVYSLERKEKGGCVFTSIKSERSFKRPAGTVVYVTV